MRVGRLRQFGHHAYQHHSVAMWFQKKKCGRTRAPAPPWANPALERSAPHVGSPAPFQASTHGGSSSSQPPAPSWANPALQRSAPGVEPPPPPFHSCCPPGHGSHQASTTPSWAQPPLFRGSQCPALSQSWMRPPKPCGAHCAAPCRSPESRDQSQLSWMRPPVPSGAQHVHRSRSPESRDESQQKTIDLTMGMVILAAGADFQNSYERRAACTKRIKGVLETQCVNPQTKLACQVCEDQPDTDEVLRFCDFFTDWTQRRRHSSCQHVLTLVKGSAGNRKMIRMEPLHGSDGASWVIEYAYVACCKYWACILAHFISISVVVLT